MSQRPKAGGISDEAVAARTGKGWDEWFAILDAAGGTNMTHQERVALAHQHGAPDWWQQMIAVTYEQGRGLREKHQTSMGYQASASRTFSAPVDRLYQAWADEGLRARWLTEPVVIRKATPNKSLRITWAKDNTHVDVNIYARGEARSQVSLSHIKLPGRPQVEQAKGFWKEALERLRAALEE